MSNQTLSIHQRHRRAVFHVMDYIEDHIDEKHTLEQLARLVSYSPYHFHRLFKAVTGENLNEYIKRVRLERALVKVLYHDTSLSEIALECGFSSIGDFSRSFRQFFDTSPSEYRMEFRMEGIRNNRKICEMDRKITERYFDTNYYNESNPDGTTRIIAKQSLKVTVKELPSYTVIYERCIGKQNTLSDQEDIRQAFESVTHEAAAVQHVQYQSIYIGVPYPLPIFREKFRQRYDACRTVPAGNEHHIEMGSRQLAGGTCGVIRLEQNREIYDIIIDSFIHEWLPESGYMLDDRRPVLELYPVSDIRHAREADVCIPIMKRQERFLK